MGSNPIVSAIFLSKQLFYLSFFEALFFNPTLNPTRLRWWGRGKVEVIPTHRRSVD